MYLCICLSMYLCIYIYLAMYVSMYLYLCIYLSISLSIYVSIPQRQKEGREERRDGNICTWPPGDGTAREECQSQVFRPERRVSCSVRSSQEASRLETQEEPVSQFEPQGRKKVTPQLKADGTRSLSRGPAFALLQVSAAWM